MRASCLDTPWHRITIAVQPSKTDITDDGRDADTDENFLPAFRRFSEERAHGVANRHYSDPRNDRIIDANQHVCVRVREMEKPPQPPELAKRCRSNCICRVVKCDQRDADRYNRSSR